MEKTYKCTFSIEVLLQISALCWCMRDFPHLFIYCLNWINIYLLWIWHICCWGPSVSFAATKYYAACVSISKHAGGYPFSYLLKGQYHLKAIFDLYCKIYVSMLLKYVTTLQEFAKSRVFSFTKRTSFLNISWNLQNW